MIGRNDPCWCGSEKKWKQCHAPERSPQDASNELSNRYRRQFGILIKTPEQIEGIRAACHLAARILEATCVMARQGVTTQELNDYAHKLHVDAGAIPAPLHYGHPPFPKSICTSINEVICHGIPDDRPLDEGDIINIDVTCILKGYYGDCSRMVIIGKTDPMRKKVVDVCYECLRRSIEILRPGVLISEIGEVIETYATAHGCSVVFDFVAHGTGVRFHEPPQIPHCTNEIAIPLAPGMTFTIEPMINAGAPQAVIDPNDQWTARTIDGKPSAQWEHTLLITPSGHEILTLLASEPIDASSH